MEFDARPTREIPLKELRSNGVVDADKYAEALEPPAVRIGGRVYRGRVLSVEEWQPYGTRARVMQEALEDAVEKQKAGATTPETDALVQNFQRALDEIAAEFFRAVFQRPPWWALWRRDPVPALMAHPLRTRILRDFFGHQVKQIKKLGAHLTDGNDSPS